MFFFLIYCSCTMHMRENKIFDLNAHFVLWMVSLCLYVGLFNLLLLNSHINMNMSKFCLFLTGPK